MPSWSAPLVGPGLAVDLARPIDLSLRVAFDGGRAFSLPAPTTGAVSVGAFVGDVRRGGSCNCETHTITPHGDGTHTEGVGHLVEERIAVVTLLTDALLPALVVQVTPKPLDDVGDEVTGNHAPDDLVIDAISLESAIDDARDALPQGVRPRALVIGTRRIDDRFSGTNPPYLTLDAAEAVRVRGYDHLLVDLPSLDREDDGGLLGAHRAFFDIGPRQTRLGATPPPPRTVTELCAVPASLASGLYALSLQLAPIAADAVPSRPLLFPVVAADVSWLRHGGDDRSGE